MKELSYNGKYEIDSNSNILSNINTFPMIFLETKNKNNVAVTIKLYEDENLNFMIYIIGLKKELLTL